MFMGPLEAVKPWSTRSIEGVDRFLNRVWRLGEIVQGSGLGVGGKSHPGARDALHRTLHETIKRVTEDIETLRLNTAISALMILVNAMYETLDASPPRTPNPEPRTDFRAAFETLVLLLAPFAPH